MDHDFSAAGEAANGDARPEIDASQVATFFNVVFRHARKGGFVRHGTFEHRHGAPAVETQSVRISGSGTGLEPVAAAAIAQADRAAKHRNPAVFAPVTSATFKTRKASEDNIANGIALSLEFDDNPAVGSAKVQDILGPSTVRLFSGSEWTDPETGELVPKEHVYCRLAVPTDTPEGHAALKQARKLATTLAGGDPTNVTAVHPMRCPGTPNRKSNPPKRCWIVELNPDAEIDLYDALEKLKAAAAAELATATGRYADQLREALGLAGKPGSGEAFAYDPDERDADLDALADIIPNDDEPWHAWNSIGLAFYAASGGSSAGLNAWDRWSQKSAKHDGGTFARWDQFRTSPPTRTGMGALVNRARQVDPGFRLPSWGEKRHGSEWSEFFDDTLDGAEDDRDLSHDGLALEMGHGWRDSARFVAKWGRWLFWNGSRWEADENLAHLTRTREFLRAKGKELQRWAQQQVEIGGGDAKLVEGCKKASAALRSAKTVAYVSGLVRSNPELVATVGQWDGDSWVLNTPGGIVDLRTGALRPSDPAAYCTKATAVAPAPVGTTAPIWQTFLERIFRHDPQLIRYLQRVAGYALTGETSEQVLIFAFGQGGNGKGACLNTLTGMMGDYAAVAPSDMLLVSQGDRHPTDMAGLRGARFVTAQELARGKAWDEPKLKSLTGGDPITARLMRQDFFTYTPQFTLVVAGNNKPSFKGIDEAIRRRVQLVPFLQNIPAAERDKGLPHALRAEWPAILRWCIEGCLMWQREGLNPPESVRQASEQYLNAEDVLGQWLEDCCLTSPRIEFCTTATLYQSWVEWCAKTGQVAGSSKAFSQKLSERGFEPHKKHGDRGFKGITVSGPAHRDTKAETGAKASGSADAFEFPDDDISDLLM
jgi:putative DNA primase/helicase